VCAARSRVEEKAVDAREGCLNSSYPKGTFQVRRGRTNVEARQEVDPGAGAIGRWLFSSVRRAGSRRGFDDDEVE
jgi:hypothetical protein